MAQVKVGTKAPEFCLSNDDGQNICLKDLRGKRVALFFFVKANTSG